MVRGFSGFGSALIFVPLAGRVLPPFAVLGVLATIEILGPIPTLPRALREGSVAEVGRLALGAALGLPAGLALLSLLPVTAFRWAASLVALGLLGLLATGWHWRGGRSGGTLVAAGALSGLLGGTTGMPGPPVILMYVAGRTAAAAMRANMLMYLALVDLVTIAALAAFGRI